MYCSRDPEKSLTTKDEMLDDITLYWLTNSYHKLIYFHEVDRGGLFAGGNRQSFFTAKLRAMLRSLR
ncbi:hypothetical protein EHS13_14940 [Paenibacillus psychroresistens]|uniref:Uncharacterized protein n=1 Tax=Paenibacillus psychroresistens TaxID=1778678 RepID=A0A6B8RIJ3_9BACL|nr:hypothetical protein EHS13_14940 [Paenibacillus psychroresistens]